MRISAIRSLILSVVLGCAVFIASVVQLTAQSSELQGDPLRELMFRGVWDAEHEEYGYWSWDKGGTVCLRIGDMAGDCADTGEWKVTGNVVCYELGWWGESVGERENCFTVQDLGDGRYETLFYGGNMVSRMFAFEVLS